MQLGVLTAQVANPHVWNGNTIHVCLPTACSREIPFGFLSTTEVTAVHVHSALGSLVRAGYQAMLFGRLYLSPFWRIQF